MFPPLCQQAPHPKRHVLIRNLADIPSVDPRKQLVRHILLILQPLHTILSQSPVDPRKQLVRHILLILQPLHTILSQSSVSLPHHLKRRLTLFVQYSSNIGTPLLAKSTPKNIATKDPQIQPPEASAYPLLMTV
jgi:hypothetical protein